MELYLFSSGRADSSRLVEEGGIFFDVVRHKTFIEIGEKETEAAGVVLITTTWGSSGVIDDFEPIIFRADRPFIYIVRDKITGAILFIGRYMEPEQIEK